MPLSREPIFHDRQTLSVAGGATTNSATFVDIPGISLTTKDLSQTASYLVVCSLELEGNANGWFAAARVCFGGVEYGARTITRGGSSKDDSTELTVTFIAEGITAGQELQVQWHTSGMTILTLNALDLVIDGIPDPRIVT